MNNTTIVADGELVLTDLNLLFSSGAFRLIFSLKVKKEKLKSRFSRMFLRGYVGFQLKSSIKMPNEVLWALG